MDFVEDIFKLPSDNHYSAFCRDLLNETGKYDAWRFEELPLDMRQELEIEEVIAEGVALEKNDRFSLWLSCFLPEDETYLSRKMIQKDLKKFIELKKKNKRLNRLIILTTAIEIEEVLITHPVVRVYNIEDQEEYAHLLQKMNTPSTGKFKLYSYQEDDLTKIMSGLSDKGSRQLFDAYCGYGKTNIFIELVLRYHQENPNALIILTFPLLTIQNQTTERFYKHIKGMDEYDPLMLCFSSSSTSGILHSTSDSILKQFIDEEGPKIILTTYVSFSRLIFSLGDNPIPIVIFDEVHNFNEWTLFHEMKKTNFIGFTATPLHEVRKNFTPTVHRNLSWSVGNGTSSDFELVCYNLISEPNDSNGKKIIELFNHRLVNKLLVIANQETELLSMIKYVKQFDIPYHIVVARDSQNERRRKEKEIEEADRGILFSIRIYREGIDFPWMDGVILFVKQMQQYQAVQSFLRVTRTSFLKKNARVFIPIDEKIGMKFYHHPSFKMIVQFISFLTNQKSGDEKFEAIKWFYQRIQKITINQIEETLTIEPRENFSELENNIISFCRDQELQKTYLIREDTWLYVTAHTILSLSDGNTLSVSKILQYARQLGEYKKSYSKTPQIMLKRALTLLFQRYEIGYLDIRGNTCYFDRPSLVEIAGPKPENFPV